MDQAKQNAAITRLSRGRKSAAKDASPAVRGRLKLVELLLEVSRRMAAYDTLDDVLRTLVEMTTAELDAERGFDHGTWVPLLLAWPAADIPVVQLASQPWLGPAHQMALGRALRPLAEEGVLVIGSGSFTQNLGRIRRDAVGAPEPPDIVAFSDWMHAALIEGRTEDLLAYRRLAPYAAMQHPTDEHLLPLYVALGAAAVGAKAERLHASADYGVLRMDAFAFHA